MNELHRARLARYEGHPDYRHTAAACRAWCDAIARSPTYEDLVRLDAAERLSLGAAVARVRDVETRRAAHYDRLGEHVRASIHHEVLRALDTTPPDSPEALTSLVTAIHTRGNARISGDETLRVVFVGLLKVLDDHELYERAVVPTAWHPERVRQRTELEASIAQQVHAAFAEARKFVPDWQPRWDELLAPRHRRCIPLPDDLLSERIARLRRIVGA